MDLHPLRASKERKKLLTYGIFTLIWGSWVKQAPPISIEVEGNGAKQLPGRRGNGRVGARLLFFTVCQKRKLNTCAESEWGCVLCVGSTARYKSGRRIVRELMERQRRWRWHEAYFVIIVSNRRRVPACYRYVIWTELMLYFWLDVIHPFTYTQYRMRHTAHPVKRLPPPHTHSVSQNTDNEHDKQNLLVFVYCVSVAIPTHSIRLWASAHCWTSFWLSKQKAWKFSNEFKDTRHTPRGMATFTPWIRRMARFRVWTWKMMSAIGPWWRRW